MHTYANYHYLLMYKVAGDKFKQQINKSNTHVYGG